MMNRPLFFLLCLMTWSTASAGAQSFYRPPAQEVLRSSYGGAVALGEGIVFIGEPQGFRDPGQVHVLESGPEGGWSETATLTGDDAEVGDGFGQALAADGQTVAVGQAEKGVVYVFERDAGAWQATARLSVEAEGFGRALALMGDHLLVGAPGQDARAGAIYAYRKSGGTWHEAARPVADSLAAGDQFGATLALDADRLLVSAPGHGDGGAVFSFRFEDGAWRAEGRMDGREGDRFGGALALQADVAMVGAPGGAEGLGAVYAFRRTADGWRETSRLAPPDDAEEDRALFGSALALNGDELWVGAPGAMAFAGTAYRYERGADWTLTHAFTDEAGQPRAFFAGTLAARGDVAVVGAPGRDYGEGGARIFTRHDGVWTPEALVFRTLETPPRITGQKVDCTGGAAATYDCQAVDLVSFIPLEDLGVARGVRLSDVWGWTDPETGAEYALIGHLEATAFLDLSDPLHPVYLGSLPRTEGAPGSTWRDIKVYRDHAFIVADGAGAHGMQVFDLTQLRDVHNPPVTFTETAHYDGIFSAHNIVIDEETGFAYTVGNSAGGETCGGGLHMINIQDPKHPTFAGCFGHEGTGRAKTGYSHDAQCVVYHGPDAAYRGREICFSANETAISIADVTDKENPVPIGTGAYPDFGYVHQGWLSEDHKYFFQNDELDELGHKVDRTRTLIWDVTDLDDPILAKEYFGPTSATDHNLYVKGSLMYQTNNASGLRIIDVSDPLNPVEVGHFDTTPFGKDVAGFNGTWSSYPYFRSGMIVVTSRREGVFILKKHDVDL